VETGAFRRRFLKNEAAAVWGTMIVGIEILHASRNLDLSQLLPVRFERVG
jgi:hypothetical protein